MMTIRCVRSRRRGISLGILLILHRCRRALSSRACVQPRRTRLRRTLARLRIHRGHDRWPLHRPRLLIRLGAHSGIIAVKPMHRRGRGLQQLIQRRGGTSGRGHTLPGEKRTPRLAGEVPRAGVGEARLDLRAGIVLLHLGPVRPLALVHQVFTIIELLAGKVRVLGDVLR